jgi:hypothetical protein
MVRFFIHITPHARPYISLCILQKGCVRFWDVRRSADDISNGEVLARPDSDIGHFSVGDPYSGEKPLVVWVYRHNTLFLNLMNLPLVVIMADASMSTTTQPLVVPLAEHERRITSSFSPVRGRMPRYTFCYAPTPVAKYLNRGTVRALLSG